VDSLANFEALPVDSGTEQSYQWMVNGGVVSTSALLFSSSSLANGDQVNCTMTTNAQCALAPVVTSNTIVIDLIPNIVSSVDISGSANNICQDSLVTFTATPANGGPAPSYQWLINNQPVGQDTPVYSSRSLSNSDVIGVLMNTGERCSAASASNPIAMTVFDVPKIQLTPDTIIAPGSLIVLDPVVTGSYDNLQWTPATALDEPDILQPTASPRETTVYQLTVRNSNGCSATAYEKVRVFYDLQMPSGFTPNGDGHNDLFRVPPVLGLTIGHFSVFNRWGSLVFSTANSSDGWDGRLGGQDQPSGTYVWMVQYYNPISKTQVMKTGTVELIR
jgi:gliding motility-associated-like protein